MAPGEDRRPRDSGRVPRHRPLFVVFLDLRDEERLRRSQPPQARHEAGAMLPRALRAFHVTHLVQHGFAQRLAIHVCQDTNPLEIVDFSPR
jgi:hypothetical protein